MFYNRTKKLIPYFFALIVLIGVFGLVPLKQAQAQVPPTATDPLGTCTILPATGVFGTPKISYTTEALCNQAKGITESATWKQATVEETQAAAAAANTSVSPSDNSPMAKYLSQHTCGFFKDSSSIWPGCALQISYGLFNQLPSFLLWCAAYFFNVLISITMNGALFSSPFVSTAWGVVRDLSNLFFILILLYVAIQLILDLGGHDAKKTIAKVVIIALLINFSMFFTEVVIDSSNILALIFYNKMSVSTNNADGKPRPYESATGNQDSSGKTIPGTGEKDVAGGIANGFDPTRLLTDDFFQHAGTITVEGQAPIQGPVSESMVIGITILAGALMLFAAYAFFIAGFSFLGRMIELFVLIVFSPFAFMSFTTPLLSGIKDIGWSSWSKKLLSVSFMAPIFMFFLYFIFLLIQSKIFDSLIVQTNQTTIMRILSVVIPALLILVLLLKATKYAKEGSGAFGEVLIKGATAIGGIAMGAVTGGVGTVALGGAATLGRTAIGGGGGLAANKLAGFADKHNFGRTANALRDSAKFVQGKSFDVRGVSIGGKTLASATGLKLGKAQEGGWAEMKKKQEEKNLKRSEELEKRGTKPQKRAVEDAEIELAQAKIPIQLEIENADTLVKKFQSELADAKNGGDPAEITAAKTALATAKGEKKRIRDSAKDENGNVVGLDALEAKVRQNKIKLDVAANDVTNAYAADISSNLNKNLNSLFRLGFYSRAGANETARKIRMKTKATETK